MMKSCFSKASRLFCAAIAVTLIVQTSFASSLLIEAEAFQFHGDWMIENLHSTSGGSLLKTLTGARGDAVTAIQISEAGTYTVWARGKDFPQVNPGARRFKVGIDDDLFAEEVGDHGFEDFYWEKVGSRHLEAGEHVLQLHDVTQFFSRCDAVFLTTENIDPNERGLRHLEKYRVAPLKKQARRSREFPRPTEVAADAPRTTIANIGNAYVQLTFERTTDTSGQPRIVRQMQVHDGQQWQPLQLDPANDVLFLLYSPDSRVTVQTLFPSWSGSQERLRFDVNGQTYETSAGQKNPFWAGEPQALTPRSARKIDDDTVVVRYVSEAGRTVTGRWQVLPNRRDVKLSVTFEADREGEYSVGYAAFNAWQKNRVDFNLLLPLFQYQRMPRGVSMVPSSVTPHPLVMVDADLPGVHGDWTYSLIADPEQLPWRWAEPDNARYGFSLYNAAERVQPTIFQPVLGLDDSKLKQGQTKTVSFLMLAYPGDWKQTLEYTSSKVMGVTDYRQPWRSSLTDAAMNMIDTLKDEFASGWNDRLKGLYNIEATSVVTQAAPLAIVSAALLTQDEQLWIERALPTIEYTLTRPSAHFAVAVPNTHPRYVTERGIRLSAPSQFYGTAYWQGVHEMLGQANPWIVDLAFKDGDVRYRPDANGIAKWSQLLAGYRLAPTPERLAEVCRQTNQWIDEQVYGRHDDYLGMRPFFNLSFYPYWWDLIDLYELTQDERYIKAAEECAFHTISGIFTHPMYPKGLTTIHEGDQFEGDTHLWFRGDKPFRLGYPRKPGDLPEKQIPGWVVSQVGLGFEQPSTYFASATPSTMKQIMMSNWAPHLLRLYRYTGRDIYLTYARNTIIGRWANYPGYYIRGFTDAMQNPRYTLEGPDVTSIYYHHLPPQLAFTIDYIVTEAENRSDGAIDFPWVKQQGYVWFVNRIYGPGVGRVFDDTSVKLRLDRTRVTVDSHMINHLVGRGRDHVYVMLMNDGNDAVSTHVNIDAKGLGLLTDHSYRVLDAAGSELRKNALSNTITTDVPARGLVVIALPAESTTVEVKLPKVVDGHQTQQLAAPWDELQAFRIRSPFGKDALYVALMGWPEEGAAAELHLVGRPETARVDRYPYEMTVYPLPMEENLTFTLKLRDSKGNVVESEPIVMPGSPSVRQR